MNLCRNIMKSWQSFQYYTSNVMNASGCPTTNCSDFCKFYLIHILISVSNFQVIIEFKHETFSVVNIYVRIAIVFYAGFFGFSGKRLAVSGYFFLTISIYTSWNHHSKFQLVRVRRFGGVKNKQTDILLL